MNPGNAIKLSHAPIEKTCVDCGEPYQVARNAAGQSSRCPDCQQRRTLELVRQRRHYNVSPYEPVKREPRARCRVCCKPAGRYPHYCSTKHYLLDFRNAYQAEVYCE